MKFTNLLSCAFGAAVIATSLSTLIAYRDSYAGELSAASQKFEQNESCCGPINSAGKKLLNVLDAADVEHLWLPRQYVNWETGEPEAGSSVFTSHCSAFTAAIGKRLNVYMLRPPEHSPLLLASAQTAWLGRDEGKKAGWIRITSDEEAQRLSNAGQLVVATYESPYPRKPGHIAIVRPSSKTLAELIEDGPEITQAGGKNYSSTSVRVGFKHAGSYPSRVPYFAHIIPNDFSTN